MAEDKKLSTFSLDRAENLFFLNGITSLLGWNAVLSSLDYFNTIYKGYNVYLYFPIPVFVAYVLTGIIFNSISLKFNYKTMIVFGIIGTNICLLLLLIVSIIYRESIAVGFWLSIILCFAVGFASNLVQLSFFAMINYFGFKTVSRFTIGTAASGLSLIILRAVITAGFGSDHPGNMAPFLVYFLIAILFNMWDLYLNLRMMKSEEYIQQIQKVLAKERETMPTQKLSQSLVSTENNTIENKKSYAKLMWQAFLVTKPYPLYILFDFVITFMLFPNLTMEAKTTVKPTWAAIIFLIMYNIGDFTGKLVGDFRGSFNSRSITFLFYSRLFFFFTIPLMTKAFTQDDHLLNNNIFPFFNQFLFAFTNGLVINGSFILAFEVAPNDYKKYAGILGGILLQIGIMIGSFLAIPLQFVVKPTQIETLL